MNTEPTLLVIDDETQIRRLLLLTLEAAHFQVREAGSGQAGLAAAALAPPDAIILDLGLPDMGGLEVLRRLREWSRTPVLVLTVRDSEDEKIAALDAGADDYLTKPFSGRELLARLRAILRRSAAGADGAGAEPPVVRAGNIEMDMSSRILKRTDMGGAEVALTAKEYALLKLLAQHRGRIVTHRQILREVWGPEAEGQTHYLRVQMTHLRRKLEINPREPRLLRTEAGIGYRLIE